MKVQKSVIALLAVAAIAVVMICLGASLLADAGQQRARVHTLVDQGQESTVTDARVKVFQGSDGERRVVDMEVEFTDATGATRSATLRTTPTIYVAISGPDGWEEEFPGKEQIVGSTVRYLTDTPSTVELESELASPSNTVPGFLDIFGVALCTMGEC